MIYAYYGNKEQLYTAVLDEVYSRMADKEKELLNRELDCEEMIKCVIQHYFSFLHETPAFVRMVMGKPERSQVFKAVKCPEYVGAAIELYGKA